MSSSTDKRKLPKAGQFPAPDPWRLSLDWYSVANFIHGSEDFLEKKYQSDPWLFEFSDSMSTQIFNSSVPARFTFTSSRDRFMADPTRTLERLQSFERDLRLEALASLMRGLPPKLRDCFIFICAELIARDKDEDIFFKSELAKHALIEEVSYNPPASDKVHIRHSEVANRIFSQMKRYGEDLDTRLVRIAGPAIRLQRNVEEIIVQARKDLGEKPVEFVVHLFNLFMETDEIQPAQFHALVDKSGGEVHHDQMKIDTTCMSYYLFVHAVQAFVQQVTGHGVPGLDESDFTTKVQLYFNELRKYGAEKREQFEPLYLKIQDLNDTVESQKQMITALVYRHLIEHLPDRAHYNREKKKDKLSEAEYWKLVWEDMVKQELCHMIEDDIEPKRNAVPRDLTTMFEYSFRAWRGGHKTETSIPPGTYKNWPNYQRGEALYGELSNNIHLYQGRQETTYNIHESNWSITDRTILSSLKPKTWPSAPAGDGTVNWSAERKKRGLPEKEK